MNVNILVLTRRALRSGLVSGAFAAAFAGWRASAEGATAVAPLNAVTHCLWPRRAFQQTRPSVRYTLSGAAIHAGSAVFWATLFEALCNRLSPDAPHADPVAVATAAAATAATAYVVDYHVVPERLQPGFDAHVSRPSLTGIYIALAAGLAVSAWLDRTGDGS
ncbi:hypothetical protein [Paraburkholderia sp. XV]|uniref:hypothetical protein n=1 Tax=Paraburkholderia sp. XV TaxID=2831520 RepID=UPI001CD711B4|nr:hypothetical protein [Paraburkholderia sp. XV]